MDDLYGQTSKLIRAQMDALSETIVDRQYNP
jgi:hypothetical protein